MVKSVVQLIGIQTTLKAVTDSEAEGETRPAEKTIKFHENPVQEKKQLACDGIDC